MKHFIATTTLATVLSVASSISMASDHYRHEYNEDHHDSARVTHVEPIYRTVRVSTPERECWDEPSYHEGHHSQSYTSTIAGGIIGGVIGNRFGKGSGNTAMTVAGTLLGGSIGRDMGYRDNYRDSQPRYHETCHVRERYHEEQRIDGYNVTYRYHGRLYTTYMDHHPGKFIPVEVSVRPKHYRDHDYY